MKRKSVMPIIVIASIILGIIIIGGLSYYFYKSNIETTKQSIIPLSKEKLEFCNIEQQCLSYLYSQGMPTNYLQENRLSIYCENGICYAEK